MCVFKKRCKAEVFWSLPSSCVYFHLVQKLGGRGTQLIITLGSPDTCTYLHTGTCAYTAMTAGPGPAHLRPLVCPLLAEDLHVLVHVWTAERARPAQMGVSLWGGVGVDDLTGHLV